MSIKYNNGNKPIISGSEIGWIVRKVIDVEGKAVTLDDGVCFRSKCFSGAKPNDIWAVKHEKGGACFGKIEQAMLLER